MRCFHTSLLSRGTCRDICPGLHDNSAKFSEQDEVCWLENLGKLLEETSILVHTGGRTGVLWAPALCEAAQYVSGAQSGLQWGHFG